MTETPNAENDAREMAEAVVYDTLIDDRGEAEDADAFEMACRVVADLIESGACVLPPASPGDSWKWLACCEQQSIDGHLSTCTRVTPPTTTEEDA